METNQALPERSQEAQEEITLLSWVIEQAVAAHNVAEAKAMANDKPIPMGALRVVVQAQGRRMQLRGMCTGLVRIPPSTNTKTLAEKARQMLAELETPSPETVPATPPLPLNRTQRRAMEREKKKRWAA